MFKQRFNGINFIGNVEIKIPGFTTLEGVKSGIYIIMYRDLRFVHILLQYFNHLLITFRCGMYAIFEK